MTFLDGSPLIAVDIDLDNVPPAISVSEANSRFSDRAAAAILYGASLPISEGSTKLGEDYSTRILAKMAYADYFSGSDQVPGRPITLRDEVNAAIEAEKAVGRVGSTINFDNDFPPIHIHIAGDYDVLLTGYVKLYYRFFNVLTPKARENLFDTLLSVRGPYDPGEKIALSVENGLIEIPETENHRLMIQSAKFLTNQLYYQASVADGRPDHGHFDNNRNGNGGSNPPMVDVILDMLHAYLTQDFIEYNARPYQDFAMSALLNLASYSYDHRVRLTARMVLDYVSAKIAVSSQDLRRSTPFRRRNEDQHAGPTLANGFLGSPLVVNTPNPADTTKSYEPDPQIAFYTMLAGATRVLEHSRQTGEPQRHGPGNYAFEMVHAGLSDYRIPPAILDLFVSAKSRRFYQGFHHFAGNDLHVNELYAGSPSYLITAGGNPANYAYTAKVHIAGIPDKGDSADLGIALPTTFIPSVDSGPPSFGNNLSDIIQFGQFSADLATVHLGVAPDFACGGPIYVPDAFEPAKNPGDPTLVSDGNWTFVNRGSDGTKPGYYLAIYRVKDATGQSWGFLEAYDTWLSGNDLTFAAFQGAVKGENPSLNLQFGHDEVNTYLTQSKQQIRFAVAPHSAIKSNSTEPDLAAYTNTFAHGSVINSGQAPTGPVGSGLINITNPSIGTIILDMRGQSPFHPSRVSESGQVEDTGSNREVWVDSKYPGTGPTAGDFGDPFRKLGDAINAVAVGGTINVINVDAAEIPPIKYSKGMILRAVQERVVLPP
jgi:hypothetical protein